MKNAVSSGFCAPVTPRLTAGPGEHTVHCNSPGMGTFLRLLDPPSHRPPARRVAPEAKPTFRRQAFVLQHLDLPQHKLPFFAHTALSSNQFFDLFYQCRVPDMKRNRKPRNRLHDKLVSGGSAEIYKHLVASRPEAFTCTRQPAAMSLFPKSLELVTRPSPSPNLAASLPAAAAQECRGPAQAAYPHQRLVVVRHPAVSSWKPAFCCNSSSLFESTLRWIAAARAIAIDRCLCLMAARSPGHRRLWPPPARVHDSAGDAKEGTLVVVDTVRYQRICKGLQCHGRLAQKPQPNVA